MKKLHNFSTRFLLATGGLLATGVAIVILAAPEAFYAGYGIDVAQNVDLANELKAPMGLLFIGGAFMLVTTFRVGLAGLGLAIGALVFLSYGLSRVASFVIDGVPQSGLVGAAAIELVIGALCLAVLLRSQRRGLILR